MCVSTLLLLPTERQSHGHRSPAEPASHLGQVEGAEHRWLRTVYRPGVPQLTVRAVLVGMLLGA